MFLTDVAFISLSVTQAPKVNFTSQTSLSV